MAEPYYIIFASTYMVTACTSSKIQCPDAAKHWLSETPEHLCGSISPEILNWYQRFFDLLHLKHTAGYTQVRGRSSLQSKAHALPDQPTHVNGFFTQCHSRCLGC